MEIQADMEAETTACKAKLSRDLIIRIAIHVMIKFWKLSLIVLFFKCPSPAK